MLRCNLAVLLAQRGLKISKVSADTGISRTTLTALSANRAQGIQFDTLNTLCRYLHATPDQLLVFCPVEISYEILHSAEYVHDGCVLNIALSIEHRSRKSVYSLVANVEFYIERIVDHDGELEDESLDGVSVDVQFSEEAASESCIRIVDGLPNEFLYDFRNKLFDAIFDAAVPASLASPDALDFKFSWPFRDV